MKAIDILERAKIYAEHTDSYPTPREFDEAIKELEALQNRTCESCKYFELDRFEDGRGTCRGKNVPVRNFMVDCDYCCNRYEPKEVK